MVNNELKRNYSMPDSDLTAYTQSVCASMTRDIAEFTLYGITTANIIALEALNDSFVIFPSDEYLLLETKTATDTKNMYYEQTLANIRTNATRVDITYGRKSPEASLFSLSNISKLSDNAFLTKAKLISKFLTDNLTKLATAGLTQLMINDYDDIVDNLEDAIENQEVTNKNRANATIERIEKGNEIFTLLSKYCDIGKRIWENVNPARYADYVIYGTASPTILTPPANFIYTLAERQFTWDIVPNATSYQIEESADQVVWTEVYADQYNNYGYTPTVSGTKYYRCRARNSGGYGDFSDIISIEYLNPLPAPQNLQIAATGPSGLDIEVSFDLVPTATGYWPYRSVVSIGAPAGGYSFQGVTIPTSPFTQSVQSGKRYYYKLKAVTPIQEGVFSEAVYIDVP